MSHLGDSGTKNQTMAAVAMTAEAAAWNCFQSLSPRATREGMVSPRAVGTA